MGFPAATAASKASRFCSSDSRTAYPPERPRSQRDASATCCGELVGALQALLGALALADLLEDVADLVHADATGEALTAALLHGLAGVLAGEVDDVDGVVPHGHAAPAHDGTEGAVELGGQERWVGGPGTRHGDGGVGHAASSAPAGHWLGDCLPPAAEWRARTGRSFPGAQRASLSDHDTFERLGPQSSACDAGTSRAGAPRSGRAHAPRRARELRRRRARGARRPPAPAAAARRSPRSAVRT